MKTTEEFLIETADQCKRLACVGRDLAASLETISNELMAKAVELDTSRDKSNNKGSGTAGRAPTP